MGLIKTCKPPATKQETKFLARLLVSEDAVKVVVELQIGAERLLFAGIFGLVIQVLVRHNPWLVNLGG